jgi:hypothetical protein
MAIETSFRFDDIDGRARFSTSSSASAAVAAPTEAAHRVEISTRASAGA